MPPWFEVTVSIAAAVAAVLFFAKYRETAAALHESERMKHKLSKELDRYRDVPQLRALRDGLIGERNLPVDDEGREHLLIRNSARKLVHITVQKNAQPVPDGEEVSYRAGGEERRLQELE
ncbi:hypothetical protein [Microbulbifer hydrolyticus]|uniref:Uncharacterized protein n=1 Tax=Microbulbifer hydrolyticus TaxID=48074 RepID=A0A6P1T7B5_9GAMM|nr:hypothetical protein [Microbulbifer hydrolyticus]MBB5211686.1 hypothetical protein [Microbulbifer hydrolyticus]QHQ37583.1 hypothetical protein GTQ55_00385 [Microbulbifer hydrolyticus]